MQGYLRTKLTGKKVYQGQAFTALYLGKENTFVIASIESDKDIKSSSSVNQQANLKN
jgi:hypothetical protein